MQNTTGKDLICHDRIIQRYLEEAQQQRLPIWLNLPEHGERRQKLRLVKLEPESGHLILSPQELNSDAVPFTIPDLDHCTLSCPTPNGTLRFETRLLPLDSEKKSSPYFQCDVPETILKIQQRASFRLSLQGHPSHIIVTAENLPELHGECLDLSLGGTRCRVSPASQLLLNSRLEICLSIPGLLRLTCAAIVCHGEALNGNSLQLGLQFLDLGPGQHRAIAPVLNQLERESINRNRSQSEPAE